MEYKRVLAGAVGLARSAWLASVLIALGGGMAAAEDSTKVGGRYDISIGGLTIAKATLSLVIKGDVYSAKVGMKSTGVARMFSGGKGNASSTGWLKGPSIVPAKYDLDSRSDDKKTRVSMALSKGAVASLQASPPLKRKPDRVAVTSSHKRNVLDPLSAALMPVASSSAVAGPDACARTLPIFDGWTRYDVKLGYKGLKSISNDDYSGKVVVCSARWIPVAGHRPKKSSVKYMESNRDMEIWLMPVDGKGLLVPYKVSIGTKAGPLVVQASRLRTVPPERKHAAR